MCIMIKYLMLTALFAVTISVKGDQEAFLLGNGVCITNGSSALIFNHPLEHQPEEIMSKFYPASDNDFDCNFLTTDGCRNRKAWITGRWINISSEYINLDAIVTDRRWEALKIIKNVDHSLDNLRPDRRFINGNEFSITFSARIEQEGLIFLCSGAKISQSYCYLLVLGKSQTFWGTCNGLKSINSFDHYCKSLKTIPFQFIDDLFWKHFRIIRLGNILTLMYGSQKYPQFDVDINTPNIFFYTGLGLWKIHSYTFLYSNEISNNQLGPDIRPINNKIRISMMMVMCKDCELQIVLQTKKNKKSNKPNKKFTKTYRTENEMWTEVKIEVDDVQSDLKMMVATTGESTNKFWALDDIRLSNDTKQIRYLKTHNNNYYCQKINLDRDEAIFLTESRRSTVVNCDTDKIGSFCVPCAILNDNKDCTPFKYCENINEIIRCYCTPGYWGDQCLSECYGNHYGHQCASNCTNCLTTCQKINGYCGACKSPFIGDKCDNTPVPIFKMPPKLLAEGFDHCNFSMPSFEFYKNKIGDPNKYRLQFKVKNDKNKEWKISMTQTFEIHEKSISNIDPGTVYEIRAVAVIDDEYYEDDSIPSIECETLCLTIKETDLDISVTNTTARVKVARFPNRYCKINHYDYSVLDNRYRKNLQDKFSIEDLKAAHTYVLKICYRKYPNIQNTACNKWIYKNFTTAEGIPSKVTNVEKKIYPNNAVYLQWKTPTETNGEIQNYDVKYKLLQKKGCNLSFKNSQTITTKTATTKSFYVDNLEPYAVYEFKIYAETRIGAGDADTFQITTNPTATITEQEHIKIDKFETTFDTITLQLQQLPCEKLNGQIYYSLNSTCLTPWCNYQSDLSQVHNFQQSDREVRMKNRFPFVKYRIDLLVSKTRSNWILSDSVVVKTKSSVPKQIKSELTSNGDLMALRWLPPYPPTGDLDDYKIVVKDVTDASYNNLPDILTDGKKCLWPDYHCAEIERLTLSHKYKIQILARNKGHQTYSLIHQFEEESRIGGPDKPYNVTTSWMEDNSLYLRWNHPNNTRGILKQFEIKVGSETTYFNLTSREDYKLNYNLVLEGRKLDTMNWCENVQLYISSINDFSKATEIIQIFSPPSNLRTATLKMISASNTSVKIEIKWPNKITLKHLYLCVRKAPNYDTITSEDIIQKRLERGSCYCDYSEVIFPFELELEKCCKAPLESQRNYTVTGILINKCNNDKSLGLQRLRMISQEVRTKGNEISQGGAEAAYAALLLLLVPLALVAYYFYKKRKNQSTENHSEIERTPLTVLKNIPKRLPKPTPPLINDKSARNEVVKGYNLKTQYSKKIKLTDLEPYVKKAIETGELQQQHDMFPKGLVKPHDYGSLPENKTKNRYKNLIAYDETRVKLQKLPDNEYSDYINANYIDGYAAEKVYIATQGPKQSTLKDFWRMIWQENVENIVMLANVIENGKKKVEQYWPDINEDKWYGEIHVKFISGNVFANYEVRIFDICYGNEKKKLTQLHFTTWPDHGVPLYSQSLVNFLQRVLKIPYSTNSPILVHCSAGVGRTGTVILSDICLRMAAGEGYVDFLGHLEHLREQRANLVDNVEQYKLVHLVVMECLFGMVTAIKCDDHMSKTIEGILKSNKTQAELKYLDETAWQDRAMETVMEVGETAVICPEKNRFKDIIPGKYRLFLTCYPSNDEASSYINAVQVDGFCNQSRYIVTQQPLPNTLGDFWRMVIERECTVIISLNEIDPQDKTICQFWPEKGYEISPVDFLTITHVKEQEKQYYKIITVRIQVKFQGIDDVTVDIIHMHNWKARVLLPGSIEEFLSFREEADALARKSQPAVVTCYDGATASGVYLAATFAIEKMKLEHECDVCLAVRSIRHNRKQFVNNKAQYEFVYQAAVAYLGGFQPYSNFG